jgi:phosphoribosylformylglycinamidine synthase PurS subunit
VKAKVYVSYKDGVLDPQGLAVKNAISSMGYEGIEEIRQGKYFEINLKDLTRSDAEKLIKEISEKILTNPIIEKFEYTLE